MNDNVPVFSADLSSFYSLLACGNTYGCDRASYCKDKDSEHYDWMNENCKQTCGLYGVNKYSDQKCSDWASYCDEDSDYYDWMAENCKQTCGLCCVDIYGDQECSEWSSWCDKDSSMYDWMVDNCKRTCGLCYTGKYLYKTYIKGSGCNHFF